MGFQSIFAWKTLLDGNLARTLLLMAIDLVLPVAGIDLPVPHRADKFRQVAAHRRRTTVLMVEIDGINPEPLERAFDRLLDVLRPPIQAYPTRTSIGFELVAKLGGCDYLPAEGIALRPEFFVSVRAIHFGNVKECDAAFDGRMEKRDHLFSCPEADCR
jgi:hypothetical protein